MSGAFTLIVSPQVAAIREVRSPAPATQTGGECRTVDRGSTSASAVCTSSPANVTDGSRRSRAITSTDSA